MGTRDNERRRKWQQSHDDYREEMDAMVAGSILLMAGLNSVINPKSNGVDRKAEKAREVAIRDQAVIVKRYLQDIAKVLDEIIERAEEP